jgi:hypothetical protein
MASGIRGWLRARFVAFAITCAGTFSACSSSQPTPEPGRDAGPADASVSDAPASDAPAPDGGNADAQDAGDGGALDEAPAPACGTFDGVCPAGCAPAADVDCRPAAPGLGTPCSGETCPVCQRCGTGGICEAIGRNQRDDTGPAACKAGEACDGRGHCALPQGADCQTADQCVTGHCTHNVCCDRACDQICEDCRAETRPTPRGTCVGVSAESEPNSCAMPSTCVRPGACAQLDQQVESDGENYGEGANRQFAQTFTVGRTGRLAAVRLAAGCLRDEQYRLQIQTATAAGPTGQVLSTQIFSGPSALTDPMVQFVALATPPSVVAGQILAVVFGPNGQVPPCFVLRRSGIYPGGGYFSQDDAGIWHSLPQYDMLFSTYVMP